MCYEKASVLGRKTTSSSTANNHTSNISNWYIFIFYNLIGEREQVLHLFILNQCFENYINFTSKNLTSNERKPGQEYVRITKFKVREIEGTRNDIWNEQTKNYLKLLFFSASSGASSTIYLMSCSICVLSLKLHGVKAGTKSSINEIWWNLLRKVVVLVHSSFYYLPNH